MEEKILKVKDLIESLRGFEDFEIHLAISDLDGNQERTECTGFDISYSDKFVTLS
jgi:hypothetical protein